MAFIVKKTDFAGLLVFEPQKFTDNRGWFLESYKSSEFEKLGLDAHFVQDNHSCSKYGVIRGLHFQKPPFAQGKLVRALAGSVLDIAVDLRKSSKTFGKYFALELNTKNNLILWIPEGFAHGFVSLEDESHLFYKCTKEYNKESEAGIMYNDPLLHISWPKLSVDAIVSEKDLELPLFSPEDTYFN